MTAEEKAKAYDEALERARKYRDEEGFTEMEDVFPELRENEDERIRKELIEAFEAYDIESSWNLIPVKHILAWLEKQKEQKPAEWSKNDTVFLNEITDFFENKTVRLQHDIDMYAHWLKSLPERFNLQPKEEWSEEDEQLIGFIFDLLNDLVWRKDWAMSKEECLERLKSLRPSWKPSEEQMGTLERWLLDNKFKGDSRYVYPIFESLYNDLKRLM